MIVQTAPEGGPKFVITMANHMTFAGRMARAFGNDQFDALDPLDEMLFLIENHDNGWTEFDNSVTVDPETGLPFHLLKTPREETLNTGYRSPEFNKAHHPYCGLLDSMHIWGLYNGRYGYSDQVLINDIPAEWRPKWDTMLADQLAMQDDLKKKLAETPKTAAWIEEPHLFQNYKQLQFFDTLALYFNMSHPAARKETQFHHVPLNEKEDITVTVTPIDETTYGVSPYPFRETPLEVPLDGRYLSPLSESDAARAGEVFQSTPLSQQEITLVAG